MRDDSVRHGMEVSALLGLEELGADRRRWAVPPEASHHVGRPGRLVRPARRCDVGAVLHEVEPVPSRRNRPVPLERHLRRAPPEVQVLATLVVEVGAEPSGSCGQIADRLPDSPVLRLRR